MERTGLPMGYIDPADPNYGRRPPGYMGGGGRLHYDAGSRIPLPASTGPGGVGYRPPMYLMEQGSFLICRSYFFLIYLLKIMLYKSL